MTRPRLGYLVVLIGLGVGWGSTQSLGKIAVSTGYGPFGLLFWQLVVGVLVLGCVQMIRRRAVPLTPAAGRFVVLIALIGTIIPNTTFYLGVTHLPAGIMSILISAVPLLSLPIAVLLGKDRFGALRVLGLLSGFAGVALIGLPQTALTQGIDPMWLAIALVGPLFYAVEGNVVATWGTAGLDPVQTIFGASVAGVVLVLPLAIFSGQWIDPTGVWGAPETALILNAALNVGMYVVYIWLAQKAGAVFAAQVGYVVTVAGIGWATLLMGERFGPLVWLATALMFVGVALVQPRGRTGPVVAD